eukprot:gnl/TRDRNA2_/TRDRNA2_162517_c0_seq3.p1 gnl/TRDRNA2_/TRDRNA2_162517_c0~~gnl/TRDRNA2_/TRDRNA2_162517_c0_seq3.p1  ORF type:complete len:403 (+),score=37.28 gnl/TRDRNA2_/TRDRNA2_162517_c0_seq3:50-1210(+)
MDSDAWCTALWCYVDPCSCNQYLAPSSWFTTTIAGKGLYYSYQICDGVDTFTVAACSGISNSITCDAEEACMWDSSKPAPSPAPPPAYFCRAKTWGEIVSEYRAKEGCPNADPSNCTCTGNQQDQYDCPGKFRTLWDSAGQKCVKARPDKDASWAKHDWDYPATYGDDCVVHPEPGSFHCTQVVDMDLSSSGRTVFKPHAFDDGHFGYNTKMDTESWCTAVWCYVDVCSCNQYMAPSSWFVATTKGKSLYYSYGMCGVEDTFTKASCTGLTDSRMCRVEPACVWTNSTPSDPVVEPVTTTPAPAPPPGLDECKLPCCRQVAGSTGNCRAYVSQQMCIQHTDSCIWTPAPDPGVRRFVLRDEADYAYCKTRLPSFMASLLVLPLTLA